VLGELFEVSF
jgi:hypothetical protein